MKKYCDHCGKSMKRTKIKKGSMYRRAMWRYECVCGHTEAIFGDEERENAIAMGLLDFELAIPKYPDAQ